VTLTVGSLFSGIGGLDLGLERAGMKILWQCENDPFCQKVLRKHWPEVELFDDVRRLDGRTVVPVDVLCGGFPCQDVSSAGKRRGIDEGTRSGLWWEFLRIIREVKPRWVVVENVSGLLTIDDSRGFGRVLDGLADAGYVSEWKCYRAHEFGLPHSRLRVFIVAYSQCDGDDKYVGIGRIFGKRSEMSGIGGSYWEQFELVVGEVAPSEWRVKGQPTTSRPLLLRVDNGVPGELDRVRRRLKQCGNAVVPQVAEHIGRLIVEADRGAGP